MISRLILPLLLIAASIAAQSEEFLRLKHELEDRIARLRPEAREVAERLKAVFEARLPKEEAKARLNAVLESASDEAKAALETLKPDRKIDPEVVIHLPVEKPEEEHEDHGEAERILERIAVPGIDRIAATADRLNLSDKTLAEALRDPNFAARLGVDRAVLGKIEKIAGERRLANNTVDNVLQTLRYNLSSVITFEERARLEKFASAKNITSLEQLFEMRMGGGGWRPKPDVRGEVDRFFNGADGNIVEKIRQRFGNDSSMIEKFWSNATGDFGFLGNVSEKNLGVLLGGLTTGNFSLLDKLFNGTDASNSGLVAKIKDAFKNGNFSAILNGSTGKNGTGILDSLKSMLSSNGPGGAPSTSSDGEGTLTNLGSVLPSSLKNLFG